MSIILYIIWSMYSFLEGFREAFYWDMKSKTSYTKDLDLHPFFALQRGLVIVLMFMLQWNNLGWLNSFLFCVCMSIAFPFIHDGVYYTTRNYLDKKIYPKTWFDQSVTSTAKMTKIFTPTVRTACFIIGTICIFFL